MRVHRLRLTVLAAATVAVAAFSVDAPPAPSTAPPPAVPAALGVEAGGVSVSWLGAEPRAGATGSVLLARTNRPGRSDERPSTRG